MFVNLNDRLSLYRIKIQIGVNKESECNSEPRASGKGDSQPLALTSECWDTNSEVVLSLEMSTYLSLVQ